MVINSWLDGSMVIVCLSGKYKGDLYPMSTISTDDGYVTLISIKEVDDE